MKPCVIGGKSAIFHEWIECIQININGSFSDVTMGLAEKMFEDKQLYKPEHIKFEKEIK